MDGKVAGKIINFYEAELLTRGFSVQNYGVTFTYFDIELVKKVINQSGVKYLAIFNGLNNKVPCLVLVGIGSEGKMVGDMALEFGASCPPACLPLQ